MALLPMVPSQEFIDEAKKKHGKIYATSVANEAYYFRPIKRGEHLAIQKEAFPDGVPLDPDRVSIEDNARLENLIVKSCVIWPETIEPKDLGAGVPPVLVAQIMKYSGFGVATEPEEV